MKLYSNEIVFRGHPDKMCDQIGDALLDAFLSGDPNTRAGIEVTGGKGVIFVTGEVTSNTEVDVTNVVRRVISDIGYNGDKYEVINNIGKQSQDIALGTNDEIGGAGDQGMMFGYACTETKVLVPKAMAILQEVSKFYDSMRKKYSGEFYPDGKAQITGYYDGNFELYKIKTFTLSYQNPENNRTWADSLLTRGILNICDSFGIEVEEFLINPTGKFLIGGTEGDAGVLGRKIVVDSYQSFAPVGGGAMSGKDPTKVDRSGAYKARQLAVRALKEFELKWCEVQLSYAIGVAEPLAIYIDSDKGFIEAPQSWFKECTPARIIKDLDLRKPKYEETAKFGHFGNNFVWDA